MNAPPNTVAPQAILRWIGGIAAGAILTLPAFADSIAPSSVSETIATGGSATVHKTVTVSAGTPTSAKADIFFVADTTGSMSAFLNTVKSAASSMLGTLSGLGDVQFGVAHYNDQTDAIPFQMNTNLTDAATAASAISSGWVLDGGGDYPETFQNALKQVADTGAWRPGSQRFIVWFGDAPSHPEAGGSASGGAQLVTTADAIAAMTAKGIKGEGINVGSADIYGPSGPGFTGLNDAGQVTSITSGTGGAFFDGINTTNIVNTITSAITTSFATYSTVAIDTSEAPAGVGVTVTPASYSGSFDRSIDRTFNFDVTFDGVAPGTYSFNLYGTVDGGRVATEADRIVVTGGTVPDTGSTLMLLGGALGLLAALRRRSRR